MGHVVMLVRNLQQFVEIVALGNICTIRTRKPSFQIRCLRYLKTVAADMATFSTSECKCQRLDGKVAVVTASTAGCVLYYRDAGYMRICDRIFCQNPHIAFFPHMMAFSKLHMRKSCRICLISKNLHIFAHMTQISAYAIAFFQYFSCPTLF